MRIVKYVQQLSAHEQPEPPRCWKCDSEVELPDSWKPCRCWHCGALLITKKTPHEPESPNAPRP
jgi:hypothetical protein